MSSFYGYSAEEWARLVDAAAVSLKRTASLQRDTSYTTLNRDIAARTGLVGFDFSTERGRAGMGHLLGDVVLATVDEGQPADRQLMLSAIVMYVGSNEPGPGFYSLATALKLLPEKATKEEKFEFWVKQYRDVISAYATGSRRHPRSD